MIHYLYHGPCTSQFILLTIYTNQHLVQRNLHGWVHLLSSPLLISKIMDSSNFLRVGASALTFNLLASVLVGEGKIKFLNFPARPRFLARSLRLIFSANLHLARKLVQGKNRVKRGKSLLMSSIAANMKIHDHHFQVLCTFQMLLKYLYNMFVYQISSSMSQNWAMVIWLQFSSVLINHLKL